MGLVYEKYRLSLVMTVLVLGSFPELLVQLFETTIYLICI